MDTKKAFVLMPFREPYDSYYAAIFKPALEAASYAVSRADDLYSPTPIMHDIQKSIINAQLVLCEMSERNPNVFYELGLAHAIGKPAILVARKEDDIPFDLRHIRVIVYDYTRAGWEQGLLRSITAAAQAVNDASEVWPPPMTVAPGLTARDFFKANDYPSEIKTHLRSAKTAVFWGTVFTKFIPDLRDNLEASLRRGLEVKCLLLTPDGAALEMANLRGRHEDKAHRKTDLVRNLSTLASLASRTPPGKLERKVIDYLGPYTMVAFDEELETGRMFVWLATLGVPNTNRPMFELSKTNDLGWFTFFADQFRLTWNKAAEPPTP